MSPNEIAIRQAVGKLAASYTGWSAAKTEAFVHALSDMWSEDVEAGVLTTLRDWKAKDAPAPGFVRERALARRTGRVRPTKTTPSSGPVAWHDAKLPLSDGEDSYLRDADGRYVMLPARAYPRLERDDVPSFFPEEWDDQPDYGR